MDLEPISKTQVLSTNDRRIAFSWTGVARISFLLTALALVVALRLFGLEKESLTPDEYSTFVFVPEAPYQDYLPINAYRMPDSLPLYFTLLHAWEKHLGFSARQFSVLCSLLTACLIYRLGARIFSPFAAIIAVLLFALSPINLFYGQAIRPYALYTLLSMASLCCVERLATCGPNRTRVAWSILFNVLLVYCHLIGGILIAAEGLFLLWLWRSRLGWLVAWSVPQLLLLIPVMFMLQIPEADPNYPPIKVSQLISNTFHADSPIYSSELIPSYENWAQTIIGYYNYRNISYISTIALGVLSLAALLIAVRRRSPAIALIAFCMLSPAALLYLSSWFVDPISLPRYILYVNPLRYILAAGALASLSFAPFRWLGAAVLIILASIQVTGILPHGARPEVGRAGEYIRQHSMKDDFIVSMLYPDRLYIHFPLAGDMDRLGTKLITKDLQPNLPYYPAHSISGVVATIAKEFSKDENPDRSAWVAVWRFFESTPVKALEDSLRVAGLHGELRQYYGYNGFSLYRVTRQEGVPIKAPALIPSYDTEALLKAWGVPLPDSVSLEVATQDMALLFDDPPSELDAASNYVALTLTIGHRNPALAESVARTGLKRYPGDGCLQFALGVTLLLLDRHNEAQSEFRGCLSNLPTGAVPVLTPVVKAAADADFVSALEAFEHTQRLSGDLLYEIIGEALEAASELTSVTR